MPTRQARSQPELERVVGEEVHALQVEMSMPRLLRDRRMEADTLGPPERLVNWAVEVPLEPKVP